MIIRNYLTISYRNLLRNKRHVAINVLGLAIAVGCCVIAYLNFISTRNFDSHHYNAGEVYRVNALRTTNEKESVTALVPVPIGQVLKDNGGDAKAVIRFARSFSQLQAKEDFFEANVTYTDEAFFQYFNFTFLAGNPSLKNSSSIFLSESMSTKLFGTVNAVGKSLHEVSNNDATFDYLVAGVFKDQPLTSSFQGDAFVSFDNYFSHFKSTSEYWTSYCNLFVVLNDASRATALADQLKNNTTLTNKYETNFQLQGFTVEPFSGMAQRDASLNGFGVLTSASTPMPITLILAVMALLILAIACFNLTNTLVAIATKRMKEIGIRKVMGSLRKQIVIQFVSEAFLICLLSVILGLAVSDLLMLAWNEMWPFLKIAADWSHALSIIAFLLVIVLLTTFASGFYPALLVSKFQPAEILKGKADIGDINYFNKALIALQFVFSAVALFFSIAFYQNARYQRNFDVGFENENVITCAVRDETEFRKFQSSLDHHDIVTTSGSKNQIFNAQVNQFVVGDLEARADIVDAGEGFATAMGLTFTEGRDFLTASENDKSESIIITRNLATSLGYQDESPLDKVVTIHDTVKVHVIGVVEDLYTRGMWRDKPGIIFRLAKPEEYRYLMVRTTDGKASEVNDYMRKTWSHLFPGRRYIGSNLKQMITIAEDVSRNVVRVFTFLAIVSLLLSVAGLYSTVSLNLARRVREVGIRKVFGASVRQIIWSTNFQFIIILLMSTIIGCVLSMKLAGYMMNLLWAYYQDANAITFIACIFLVMLLAAMMIGGKVYKAAMANPADSLRE